ncbi:uncharacterized protein BYT42DRAFT_329864 [Radiomyces spectabilis]|uniref:uncharacterized protein n=1 Tax=Radiomyces spectabilis TaxID=64574 RepID=UPI00221FD533|nr:uncharacterized protein BYT42DRAFT_329864 [Radiomyces spectabilis]KAI8379520.1 hypothetical protein BYT42DRAFT_329864 [Radiomyces spectabilis]
MKLSFVLLTLFIYSGHASLLKRADVSGAPQPSQAQPAPSATVASNADPSAAAPTGPINTAPTLSASGIHSQANASQSIVNSDNNPFIGKPTSASFSNDIPPAYLTWKKPIPNQTFPPLYKIGVSNITFEWTVDPQVLKVQPQNITVALANPQKQTFTAAVVPGTATSAHWDLARLPPNSPLMVGYYTVWVYDQRGPKAFPSPGWLMPDSRLVVAMYSTEAYVGRTDSMFCPTCYLGGSSTLRETFLPLATAFGVAIFTSVVVLLSL